MAPEGPVLPTGIILRGAGVPTPATGDLGDSRLIQGPAERRGIFRVMPWGKSGNRLTLGHATHMMGTDISYHFSITILAPAGVINVAEGVRGFQF